MDIKACHKSLASQLLKALNLSFIHGMQPEDIQQMYCNDTDFVSYTIIGINQKITLQMICIDADKIWNYSGKYMCDKYYQDVRLELVNAGTQKAVKVQIDNDVLENVRKNFKETKQTGILTGKKKFDAIFTELSNRLACIKRHFFASPFEMMLTAVKNNCQGKGNQNLANLCFYTKPDRKQKVWLAFQKTQLSVYYGITFQDRFQQQLGRIYFSELVDSRKHVQNAPSISVSQSQLSQFLIKSFPQQKQQKYTFSNGIVELTISGKTVRNEQGMASRLAGFRNYSYYHIQASKCYLHSRVLRRINHFQRDLNLSKIEDISQ